MDILLAGIILSFVVGASVGNYATSIIHRLPRNENLFLLGDSMTIRKPYCSACQTPLATRDLFPVVSYLLNRGKSRCCGAVIPSVYFWTELVSAALFIGCFLRFGFTEEYVLAAALGMTLIMLLSIEMLHLLVSRGLLCLVLAIGAVYRTYLDGAILPMIGGGALGLAIGLLLWRIEQFFGIRDAGLPLYVLLLAIGGTVMGPAMVMVLLAILIGVRLSLHALQERVRLRPVSALLVAWAAVLMVAVFYGN